MNAKEKALLERIKGYPYEVERIERLRQQLEMRSYKITTSYSLTGGGGGGFATSKVEAYAIQGAALNDELQRRMDNIAEIDYLIDGAKLSSRERGLIDHIMHFGTLSSYARSKDIYYTHVYKIRDGALRKMLKFGERNPFRSKKAVKS